MYNADTTPKAPRQCKYIESTIDNERQNRSKPMRTVYNTPHETFPLLCFDNQFEVAKFLWRQNQSVQLRLIPYVCLPNLCPSGLSVWV